MKRVVLVMCAVACFAATPRPAYAWGYAGHRLIMDRAIDLLPSKLKPFFEHYRSEVVLRVVDPDLWRNVGWEESPNHFLDFGVKEYGAFPFAALPRDRGAALERFGKTTLERNGLLPWRTAEMFGNLRRSFEALGRRQPYAVTDVVLLSAVAAHYVQDAHQPFHATDNHDGQLTGNDGIHQRFERDLIERFPERLRLAPAAPAPMTNPRDVAFDTLLSSYQLVDVVLKVDRTATGSRDIYDDAYFDAFFAAVRPTLEQQLSRAVTATASLIIGAWEQAGRPALTTGDSRPPQRVRR